MTDSQESTTGDSDQKEWYREAEDALERAGAALRGAWESSRDARMSALQSAKKAAQQLGDAIEKGYVGAKNQWAGSPAGSNGLAEEEE